MSTFIKKLLIFLTPICFFFAFSLAVFVLGREYYSASDALMSQKQDPRAIIGFAYSTPANLKQLLITEKNPEVFALGTSRTGQFRKEFFNDPKIFATASNSVVSIDGMKTFIEELPADSKTRLVILGLDQIMFASSHPTETAPGSSFERFRSFFSGRWITVLTDYFSGKFSFKQLLDQSRNTSNVGLNALINADGFREDGSYQYSRILTNPNRIENLRASVDAIVTMFKKDPSLSDYKEPVSDSVISSLNELLAVSKKRNIYVIGFLPPYPAATYQELMSLNDTYVNRVLQLPKIIGKNFQDNGFAFYDFSDSMILGNHDTEFVDSAHGADKMYLRMTIYMAERNKEFAKYVDIQKDKRLLENSKKDFLENVIN